MQILEIFDHTHTVFASVSFIQIFQSGTGIDPALIAESRICPGKSLTIYNAATPAGIRFIYIVDFETSSARFFLPEVSNAQPAIHATSSN